MKEKKKTEIIDGVLYNVADGSAVFTKEMKKTHKVLIPTMLPIHFELIKNQLKCFGYDAEVLNYKSVDVLETGLKCVHNDICYPSTIVIGELLHAVFSGDYDTHKIALVVAQTGGGCRASNYWHLLLKALKKAGYGYVPILSLNFSGMKAQPGWKLTIPNYYGLFKCCIYGDLLMTLKNQCKPYEKNKGETDKLLQFWIEKISSELGNKKKMKYSHLRKNFKSIVKSFADIEKTKELKPKVGIVGEIFVKYSPLANNSLEEFLIQEGAEPYVPGLVDFMLYFLTTFMDDTKLYGVRKLKAYVAKILYKAILAKNDEIIDIIKKEGTFEAPTSFSVTREFRKGYIGEGMKMGEGWLLTAEMIELIDRGVNNIICTQPFGCLPNHIVGKGMLKEIREKNPQANIIAIDYDASASKINQENRIKLMLANAKEKLKTEEGNL